MISNKFLIDRANLSIGSNLSELQFTQLSSLTNTANGSTNSVANLAVLPNVASNLGRLVYVVAENKYYYSDGVTWNINYSSVYAPTFAVYTWGSNSNGQLGNGSTSGSVSSPVTVVGGITNWSKVSTGSGHCLGLTNTGIAYAWGSASYGNTGDGSSVGVRSSPVTVVGSITNWSQLSAGGHSLGVTTTGIAYAWGRNSYGQLGDGTTVAKSSPVTVVGGITNWSQLSAGGSHSLGLTSTGIAYAWGRNLYGQLGDNTISNKSSPVTVVGGITNWSQVSAGSSHSLGLTSTGIAYAWGNALHGRLGDGTTVSKSSPVTVVGGITNWSQVSAGGSHSLGLTGTGIAYGWGYNGKGSLGDGTIVNKSSPVTVIGGITNWSQLSTGSSSSAGLTSAGVAYTWGSNLYGSLGDGTIISKSSPVTVIGGITNWSQVSGGGSSMTALVTVVKGF